MKRVHLIASGRVQGVSFRAYAVRRATELGLGGWVKNVGVDSVEAVAEGRDTDVDEFVSWMRRGPPAARVEELRVEPEDPTGEFTYFRRA